MTMPKTAMAGSIFPDLEQNQRSTAHTPRIQGAGSEKTKDTEKISKSEKTETSES